MRRRKIYSESFKRAKVQLLLKGKTSPRELKEIYGVSNASIYRWIHKYGNKEEDERIVLESKSDFVKAKELKKENETLHTFIGKQQVQLDYLKEVLNLANEHFGVDLKKMFLKK